MRWVALVVLLVPTLAWGTVYNVSSAGQLTTALAAAVAGDEIILANGTYSGNFAPTNSGADGNPITLRAANKYGAILQSPSPNCEWQGNYTFYTQQSYWIIKDLYFQQATWALYVATSNGHNNIIEDNLFEDYRGGAIQFNTNSHHNTARRNIIGHSNRACSPNGPVEETGILVFRSHSHTLQDNIIFATGDNGYTCAGAGGCATPVSPGKLGYGLYIVTVDSGTDCYNHLVQGNVLFANGGKGVLRLQNAQNSLVRDNILFWGDGGGIITDHCSDDFNTIENNLMYGNYFVSGTSKGNDTGSRGHHVVRNNTIIMDPFSRAGHIWRPNFDVCGGMKLDNTLQNNIFYSAYPMTSGRALFEVANTTTQFPTRGSNLFWANSPHNTWTVAYDYAGSDIHNENLPPIFTNPLQGDFSLAGNSPGKHAGTDGNDIGIAYNTHLRLPLVQSMLTLPTHENTGLSGSTSTSFSVNSSKYYQVWFYLPNTPCNTTTEQFTVEGDNTAVLRRDMTTLQNGFGGDLWVQPGGPARYITLGRHRAPDGTLNISWQTINCVERIFLRELPTLAEVDAWVNTADPLVTITAPTSAPTYAASTSPLTTLAGTASSDTTSVTWNNDRGGNGTASGTTTWSVPSLTLQEGVNVLTVTATNAALQTGQDTLTVTYTPPPPVTGLRVLPARTHFFE